MFVAIGSIYGTRDAGRAWYEHGKKVLETGWDKAFIMCNGLDGPEAVAHTHVDDFLITVRKASKAYRDALKHVVHTLHLKQQTGTVVYCDRTISKDDSHSVTQGPQAKSTLGLAGRTLESALTSAEIGPICASVCLWLL